MTEPKLITHLHIPTSSKDWSLKGESTDVTEEVKYGKGKIILIKTKTKVQTFELEWKEADG